MARPLAWPLVFALAALAFAFGLAPGRVGASPSSGFTATTLARGSFADIAVQHTALAGRDPGAGGRGTPWISMQRTMGASDLYVQNNVWAPGGTTGWHTHPGHSLITVTAGTVAVYEGDDPTCTPHYYTVGQGFVDEGGDHVHVIRNEGAVEAKTVAVQLIPAGATRRIDASGPSACPF